MSGLWPRCQTRRRRDDWNKIKRIFEIVSKFATNASIITTEPAANSAAVSQNTRTCKTCSVGDPTVTDQSHRKWSNAAMAQMDAASIKFPSWFKTWMSTQISHTFSPVHQEKQSYRRIHLMRTLSDRLHQQPKDVVYSTLQSAHRKWCKALRGRRIWILWWDVPRSAKSPRKDQNWDAFLQIRALPSGRVLREKGKGDGDWRRIEEYREKSRVSYIRVVS